jgi:hypothetical protein
MLVLCDTSAVGDTLELDDVVADMLVLCDEDVVRLAEVELVIT